ncbi:hypothetical protein STVA_41300 [Allostella vacuolata]|nr:hypothetical protein STVA_41300 [Stella vacuolata]
MRLYVYGAVGLVLAGLAGWLWVERSAAAALRERAVAAEHAASDARAAAVANAAAAVWQRQVAEAAQARVAELETIRGEIRVRTVTVIREIRREPDAYSPVGATLRRTAERLRQLDPTTRPPARPDPAGPPERPPGPPGAPLPPAEDVPTQEAIGSYAYALLGHVLMLEAQILKLGELWDAMAAGLDRAPPVPP